MTTESVLDDYLEQLLGDAMPVAQADADADAHAVNDAAAQVEALAEIATDVTPAVDAREPSWDDLPDEVIYETSAEQGAQLTNADSLALQAAFEAAADGPGSTAPVDATAPPAPDLRAVIPAADAVRRASASSTARPATWQDLQAEAQQAPANSARQLQRRAAERSSRWLRLRCGAQAYALELLKVQEVVLPVPLLSLRGTAPAMLGIMNLRGQVVPVLDLALHLGAAATITDSQTRIVVLEEHGDIMGLRVSAVDDVTNLADSQIESPDTARICRISNDVFRGVARLQQQPIILLDAGRLLSGS